MKYWLHRIKHCKKVSYQLFELGYLTIGFSDLNDEKIIKLALKDQKKEFNEICKENYIKTIKQSNNLWRFLTFNKGDIIIVPQDKTFTICEIIDDIPKLIKEVYEKFENHLNAKDIKLYEDNKIYKNNDLIDLGFARKIKILHKNINRNEYLDENLKSIMKIRQTNVLLDKFQSSIQNTIEKLKSKKSI